MPIDNKFSSATAMNDKQQVFDLLKQANHDLTPAINRRTFCRFSGLSLIGLFLTGCVDSDNNTSLQLLGKETEFSQFFDIIFPAAELGLESYREPVLSRIQRLADNNAGVVIKMYKRFKTRLWIKRAMGVKDYNTGMGNACLTDLLDSWYAEQCNLALDIIYFELSKESTLIATLWGRRFSLNDRKCVYWDNYDQAIS